MKYTEAWASVVSQNFTLKSVTMILGGLSILLSMLTLKLTFKDSIIIERGCYSRAIQPVKDEHSKQEIQDFFVEAISQRFDTLVQATDGMLSPDELRLRDQEQKEFANRNLKQKVTVNSATETTEGYRVDTDRVISAGEVRSAFKFPLIVKLESKPRSQSNPYGLLIVSTKQIEEKSNNKKQEGR